MAVLPSASLVIDETAGSLATGTGYCVVMAPVAQSADYVPRVVSSSSALLAQYGYAPGVDYCAIHFQDTKKPVIFIGLPIATQGAVSQQNSTGVTGTSLIAVAVGANGAMEETQGSVSVVKGGVVGTDQITLSLSLDGGETYQNVRLGTSTSYVIPYVGLTLTFGAGTLVAGDIFTWVSSAPMWGSTAIASARAALAAQQNLARSWMVVGDLPSSTFAGYVLTEANNYETVNERFVYARGQVQDRLPLASKSGVSVKMTGAPSLSFDGTAHTITRASGSWTADGFAVGDIVTIAGTTANNGTDVITSLSSTVMTFVSGLTTETDLLAAITGSEAITFASAGHTVTRSSGSWISDGFAVGQSVTFAGTASNNFTGTISALSATVMTFASGVANEGPSPSSAITCVQSYPFASWISAETAAFAVIDADQRIDLAIGRARKQSPITGWQFRRPAAWAASTREYQHDVQIPCWRKDDGPLSGWSITDANGNIVEFDERIYGGALAGRFTCLRTYGNGPLGAFVALSLTRDTDGALLSRTHNMAVADVACTVVQTETENAIGQVLVLNPNGTGTDASLSLIEQRVNSELQAQLLQQFKEGPRASKAVWVASRTDVLSSPGALLTGVLDLELNGTLEQIATRVAVS